MNWSVRSCATDSYLPPYAGRQVFMIFIFKKKQFLLQSVTFSRNPNDIGQEDDMDGAEMAHKIALGAISNSNSLLEKLPEIPQREKSSSKVPTCFL